MADYPYEGQLIADPVTFQRAINAQVTVYDAGDVTNAIPLALKDTTGLPLPNPLTSSADAFTKPFYAPSQDIKLVGAGLTVFVSSAKGMRDAAAASAEAAQEAVAEAEAAAAERVTSATVNGSGNLILTKANAQTVDAGNVKGPKGDKGDAGANGSNVLPTDDAIEAAIVGVGTKTKAALNATYEPKGAAAAAVANKLDVAAAGTGYLQPVPPWIEELPITVYGHSWTCSPGKYAPQGSTWSDRLARRNLTKTPTLLGVSGFTMAENAFSAIGNAWYTGYTGNATNPAGNLRTLAPGKLGAILVDSEVNDTIVSTAADTAHRLGFEHSLRAILAAATAGQRLEAESATFKSASFTEFVDTKFSGGSAQKTTTHGDYIEWAVTVPAGITKVFLILPITDSTNGMGKVDVSVDGSAVHTAWNPRGKFKKFTSLSAVATEYMYGVGALAIPVTPGARTIRVTSSTTNTFETTYIDALIVPSTKPPLVLVAKDPVVTNGTGPANKSAYDGIIDTVVAEFSTLNVAPVTLNTGWDTATMLGADGLHPSMLGQYVLAESWRKALWANLTSFKQGVTHA